MDQVEVGVPDSTLEGGSQKERWTNWWTQTEGAQRTKILTDTEWGSFEKSHPFMDTGLSIKYYSMPSSINQSISFDMFV